MSNYTHDIVATIGTYTDKEGNEKKRYMKCGAAFTNDDGDISIKLDGMPVTPAWIGWLSLYAKNDQPNVNPNRPPANPVRASNAPQDDIPF